MPGVSMLLTSSDVFLIFFSRKEVMQSKIQVLFVLSGTMMSLQNSSEANKGAGFLYPTLTSQ